MTVLEANSLAPRETGSWSSLAEPFGEHTGPGLGHVTVPTTLALANENLVQKVTFQPYLV